MINFGVTSYSSDKELLLIEDRFLRYKPHVVVLSFHYSNNLRDNFGPMSTDILNLMKTGDCFPVLDQAHSVVMKGTFFYPRVEGISRRVLR